MADYGEPAGQVTRTRQVMPTPSALTPLASGQLAGTMSGQYLSGQPAQDYIGAQVRQRLPGLTAGFASTGNLDSGLAQSAIAQTVANASAGLFDNERNRQLQAAGLLPTVAGQTSMASDPYFTNPLLEGLGIAGAGLGILDQLGGLGGLGGTIGKVGDLLGFGTDAIAGVSPFADAFSGTIGSGAGVFGPLAGGGAFDFGLGGATLADPFSSAVGSTFGGTGAIPSGLSGLAGGGGAGLSAGEGAALGDLFSGGGLWESFLSGGGGLGALLPAALPIGAAAFNMLGKEHLDPVKTAAERRAMGVPDAWVDRLPATDEILQAMAAQTPQQRAYMESVSPGFWEAQLELARNREAEPWATWPGGG